MNRRSPDIQPGPAPGSASLGRVKPRLVALAAVALCVVTACSSKEAGTPIGAEKQQNPAAPSAGPSAPAPGPSADAPPPVSDPEQIEGIRFKHFPSLEHTAPGQRVAYEETPPFGGPHDTVWAECNGNVYDVPVRNEHMVHSLEHGAVWITYEPEKVDPTVIDALAARVKDRPYTMMSPYPGQDSPISLQAWGYQLKVDDPQDPRIDQFIAALRQNQKTTPEPDAPCTHPEFDAAAPPPFEASPPGPNAMPEDGGR